MINAEERMSAVPTSPANTGIPKCVCGWKNCRTYQKAFREAKHAVLDGVIKLRLNRDDEEAAALKSSIDRTLKVQSAKKHDWKVEKRTGEEFVKYTLAKHHFTEKHVSRYLTDPKNYSFTKPFSVHGAKKYLYTVDENEAIERDNDDGELLFLQVPNVPKEHVKTLFLQLKQSIGKEKGKSAVKDTTDHSSTNSDEPEKAKKHVAKTTKKRNQASDGDSSGSDLDPAVVKAKEEENRILKEQLEAMQGQLSFLHDMVRKLQEEHYDAHSVKSGKSGRSKARSQNRHAGRTTSTRSARSGVPQEINLGEEWEEGTGFTDHYDDDGLTQTEVGQNGDPDDDETTATFKSTYKASRRGSNESKTNTTIVSASKSVKTLPREIELDEDEDDSESHESLEEEAFDNRSFASSHHQSTHSKRSIEDWNKQRKQSFGPNSKQPMRRLSMGQQSVQSNRGSVRSGRSSRRSTNGSTRSASARRRSLGGGSVNSEQGSSAGVYQVTALTVTDPYGEKGTYTGSISHSTGMPHGFGRLEYDRAGRWYEGDWKHGRWTGQGKLSNGDGDFYEGGLKNDHKHGLGIMRFADGRVFEGEYINGQMIEGKMSYQDGSTYEGCWVDGMRHGQGRCVFTDESIYEGSFKEGEFFGHGKMAWSDGGWYEGEWVNGEMHGKGREIRPDGSVRHDGKWAKGQPIRK